MNLIWVKEVLEDKGEGSKVNDNLCVKEVKV